MSPFKLACAFAIFALPQSYCFGEELRFNKQTKCAEIRKVLDAEPMDQQKVSAIYDFIDALLVAIDKTYAAKGQVEIIPRMSSDGYRGVMAMASVMCGSRRDDVVVQVVVDTYDGVRGVQDTLGLNAPTKKKK